MTDEILVSICMTTYNHEKYIKQAVDSILNQEMKFRYELVICDDASTDLTQQILLENYSNIEHVKLRLRERNTGGGCTNGYDAIQEAKGKYLYLCEGDDHWIGADGLQTLVDIMETHKEYSAVSGRRIVWSEKMDYSTINATAGECNQLIMMDDFLYGKNFDLTATLFRNFFHDNKYDYRFHIISPQIGDLTIALYILLHGPVYRTDKILGVYRTERVKGAVSYNSSRNRKKIFEDHIRLIEQIKKCITVKLNYTYRIEMYTQAYVDSIVSPHELILTIPYLLKMIGIKSTLKCIKKWKK